MQKWNGDTFPGKWENVEGFKGIEIAVDPNGDPWVVNTDGMISMYSSEASKWE